MFKRQSQPEGSPKSSKQQEWKWWIGILIPVTGIVLALFRSEVRVWLHLEKPPQTQVETKPTETGNTIHSPVQNPEPIRPEPSKPEKTIRTTQKTVTKVKGDDNVAGNNISGSNNVTGNSNQTGSTANAPNGIAITGGTVTNPTVNNFGPAEPTVSWSQVKGRATEDKKATVVITLKVDHTFEIPAFLALCDRPCETVGASAAGYSQANFLKMNENPNVAGFVFGAPRPLGSGVPVQWTIKSEDDQSVEVKFVEKLPSDKLPPEQR